MSQFPFSPFKEGVINSTNIHAAIRGNEDMSFAEPFSDFGTYRFTILMGIKADILNTSLLAQVGSYISYILLQLRSFRQEIKG